MIKNKQGRAFASGCAVAVAAATLSAPAVAADFGNISINGYGHVLYLKPSANTYLGADKDGSFKDNLFSLVVTAQLDTKSKVWAQITSINGSSFDAHWFYIDRILSDNLTVRAGKVLAPLGFYNEFIDARFLQQSSVLPLLYQDPSDLVTESYGGAGMTWSQSTGAGRVALDLYGGQIVEHGNASAGASTKQKSLVGGRIDWNTPIDGLRLMVSATSKKQQEPNTTVDVSKTGTIFSVGYRMDKLDFKGEYGILSRSVSGGPSDKLKTGYLQAGYDLTDKWVAFARYDTLRAPGYSSSDDSTYQNDIALGVTYKWNSNLSMRLEHHTYKGYAAPVLGGEVVAGQGKKDWNMIGASVNFIF